MDIVLHSNGMDMQAGCLQSARVARREGFPRVADRMDDFAQAIQTTAKVIILDGQVQYRTPSVEVVKVTDPDGNVYEVTISANLLGRWVWDREALRSQFVPIA